MIQEQPIRVNGMTIIRWMCGMTRKDKIRNEHIPGTTTVTQASKKITERLLNWYGHVLGRDKGHILRKVSGTNIPGEWGGDDRSRMGKRPIDTSKELDWGRARRRTQRCGERRSSVIPATFQDGRIQWTEEEAFTKSKHHLFFSGGASPNQMKLFGYVWELSSVEPLPHQKAPSS